MILLKRYYLATVGDYTKKTILHGMFTTGCSGVYLFPSSETKEKAYEIVDEITNNFGLAGSEIKVIEVDSLDYWGTVGRIIDCILGIYKKEEECEVIVDASGGTRIMTLAAITAAILARVDGIYYFFYDYRNERIIKLNLPKISIRLPSDTKLMILKVLREVKKEGIKIKQYAQLAQQIEKKLSVSEVEKIGRSKGKLSEKINELARFGFIKKVPLEEDKRRFLIEITKDGECIIRIAEKVEEINKYRKNMAQ